MRSHAPQRTLCALHQVQRRYRTVVAPMHPRRRVRTPRRIARRVHRPNRRLNLRQRYHPRTQQHRRARQRKHRRLDPHPRRPAIHYVIRQTLRDVPGKRGRKLGEAIGAGRGNRQPRQANQLQRQRVCRHTQPHRGQSGRHDIGNARLGTTKVKGPGQ
jgi:hypothetical protein